ncbi:MAG: VTT domain-containing protein [Gordonia sp. (in: high G+C Gram-positive bacteria)]|uniref:VTT domain-containing protein n=1 Tax=Gordonia sp. (in: high G+C Gram-positive bacteria) TaxID=84139 RepID=UPI0039E5E23F
MSTLSLAGDVVALPGILDPFNVIGFFGTWAFVGLLLVIFIESGVLFPVLPGDSLLFVAGLIAAGSATAEHAQQVADANFNIWLLVIAIPIAAILGGQVGYWIGRTIGVGMFKPDARFLKQRYLDEAHEFFEKHGPITIFLARFVPIVRTIAPIVAGSARMSFGKFTAYNVVGAIVWGSGITLLGYWLGQFEIIQKLIEPIFIAIVLISVVPIFLEVLRRRRAGNVDGAAS